MKKLCSAALAVCLILTSAVFGAGAFSDVPAGRWYTNPVNRAAGMGLVNGVGADRYDPEGSVTYAQFAAMLANIRWAEEVESYRYEGQPWYRAYVNTCEAYGVFEGTIFDDCPDWDEANRPIPREAMAQMAYNYLRAVDAAGTLTAAQRGAAAARVADLASVSQANQDAVLWCYSKGVLSGTGKGFDPKNTMTRAQAAVVLCNVCDTANGISITQPAAPQPSGRPADAIGGQYDVTVYNVPADANKDGWITQSEVDARIEELKIQYPNGTRWNDPAIWGTDKSTISEDGYIAPQDPEGRKNVHCYYSKATNVKGYGCAAWTTLVSDRIFGDLPRRKFTDIRQIQTGDVTGCTVPHAQHWNVYISPRPGAENKMMVESGSGSNPDSIVGWGASVNYYVDMQDLVNKGEGAMYTRYPYYPVDESELPDLILDMKIMYPELRCAYCGFYMLEAGNPIFNAAHGHGFSQCDKCGLAACAQCCDKKEHQDHLRTCKG